MNLQSENYTKSNEMKYNFKDFVCPVGRWRWISGPTSKLFTNWHPGEPNNSGDEDCAVMYPSRYSFKWNDAGCSTVYNFICEKGE